MMGRRDINIEAWGGGGGGADFESQALNQGFLLSSSGLPCPMCPRSSWVPAVRHTQVTSEVPSLSETQIELLKLKCQTSSEEA